jgi:hypothetical protein
MKNHNARKGGWSLVELTITLFLLTAIVLFGMKTMMSSFKLQNWSIIQSMTDAYVGIETAYAQRYVFDDIPNLGRWRVYPASTTNTVTIGALPSINGQPAKPVTATVIRTYHKIPYTDSTGTTVYTDPVTGVRSYLLESYVVYQDGQQKYCKVSKVYRSE